MCYQPPPGAPGAYGLLQESSPFHGDWEPTLSCLMKEKSSASQAGLGSCWCLHLPLAASQIHSVPVPHVSEVHLKESSAEDMALDMLVCPWPKRAQTILPQLSTERHHLIFKLIKKRSTAEKCTSILACSGSNPLCYSPFPVPIQCTKNTTSFSDRNTQNCV